MLKRKSFNNKTIKQVQIHIHEYVHICFFYFKLNTFSNTKFTEKKKFHKNFCGNTMGINLLLCGVKLIVIGADRILLTGLARHRLHIAAADIVTIQLSTIAVMYLNRVQNCDFMIMHCVTFNNAGHTSHSKG